MSLYKVVASDDKDLSGNWYPFPPPDAGIYDVRQAVQQGPDSDPRQYFHYFGPKRVNLGPYGRLLCMGKRVTKMTPRDGWQFRFQQQLENCVPVVYRPFAVIYDTQLAEGPATAGVLTVVRKEDISQQLPVARSREEALHIVRLIPERWPVFRQIHVEYTPEVLSS